MEDLFSLKYGIAGICVLLTILILVKVGEFVWGIQQKKETLSDSAVVDLTKALQANTVAIQLLEIRFKAVEGILSEFPKIKNDLRRTYAAIKEIAGTRWPEIRDEIMKDGFNT